MRGHTRQDRITNHQGMHFKGARHRQTIGEDNKKGIWRHLIREKEKGRVEPSTEGAQSATQSGTRQRNARHKAKDSKESAGTVTSQAIVQEIAPWKKEKGKEERKGKREKDGPKEEREKDGPKEEREESTDSGRRKTVGSGHPKNRKKKQPVWHKKWAQRKRMNNAWDSSRNAIAARKKGVAGGEAWLENGRERDCAWATSVSARGN